MHSVVVHISLDKNNLNHQQQNTFPKFAIRYLIIEEIYQCGRIKHIKKNYHFTRFPKMSLRYTKYSFVNQCNCKCLPRSQRYVFRENHTRSGKHSSKTRKIYATLHNKVLAYNCNIATSKMKVKQLLFLKHTSITF